MREAQSSSQMTATSVVGDLKGSYSYISVAPLVRYTSSSLPSIFRESNVTHSLTCICVTLTNCQDKPATGRSILSFSPSPRREYKSFLTVQGKFTGVIMPQSHPSRRDSWPPTIVRLFDDELNTIPDNDQDEDIDLIDSNPFEYFLTSPEDATPDDDYFSDLSAGIEDPLDDPSTPVREISPSSLQRLALPTTEQEEDCQIDTAGQGYAVPMSLHDFTRSHAASKKNPKRQPGAGASDAATGSDAPPSPSQSSAAPRGRRTVRLGPTNRGRGKSLESPRPHSWREPSPDVWSIPEEGETPGLSADEEAMVLEKEPPKKKKKVHWAI